MATIFNAERSNYYKAKKRELTRQKEADQVIYEDALFIHYYGMSAFIELFPEVKGFSILWHRQVLVQLQKIRRAELSNQLTGGYMAYGATQDKKSFRRFKQMIRNLSN